MLSLVGFIPDDVRYEISPIRVASSRGRSYPEYIDITINGAMSGPIQKKSLSYSPKGSLIINSTIGL